MNNLIGIIRDLINKTRTKYQLMKNLQHWNQLCSSMDVIGDTEYAIDAYLNNDYPKEDSEKYLRLYGVLQALYVQQDAVMHLCESLELLRIYSQSNMLKPIRDIRNDSIGHPTKRGHAESFHFISRVTISMSGYQLISYYPKKQGHKAEIRNISVVELIAKQRKCFMLVLKELIKELKRNEKNQKEKYKMEVLAKMLEPTHYCISALYETIWGNRPASIGLIHLKELDGILQSLKHSLAKRGIELDTYDSIRDDYEQLEYPMDELRKYYHNKKASINKKTAYIFTCYIRSVFKELEEIIKEIDEEYSA